MCKIYETRKSSSMVYIELRDDDIGYWGVRKLPIDKFDFAKRFGNMQFLSAASIPTHADKDEDDAMLAIPFKDTCIEYSRTSRFP